MFFRTNNPSLITTPVSSSARWNTGKQLDAGTLQILQNNVSTFQSQHNRTLATQVGGISDLFYSDSSVSSKRGFFQSPYTAPADFSTAPTNQQLAWGSDVAMRFGPFYLPTTSTGFARAEYLPLNVTIEISGSVTSSVYVAVNGGNNPFEATPYAITKQDFGVGEGYFKFSFTGIKEKRTTEENVIWMNSNTSVDTENLAPPYVWVGIFRESTNCNFKTITISNPRLQI